ncbi:hypothetical protein L596_028835 [Steinernema carpocapsae]|uniref:Uncharacterized protein n=1 Tax=Steinernema carpocapsae TaxID=34508 RepID=A0A4U5LZI0_STECR|nr:hypothetical protein L596_028835 [Steinernema carpocapsae]
MLSLAHVSLGLRTALLVFSLIVISLIMAGPGFHQTLTLHGRSVPSGGDGRHPIDRWNSIEGMSGLWSQLSVILLSPLMAIAAVVMGVLILLGNSNLAPFIVLIF